MDISYDNVFLKGNLCIPDIVGRNVLVTGSVAIPKMAKVFIIQIQVETPRNGLAEGRATVMLQAKNNNNNNLFKVQYP